MGTRSRTAFLKTRTFLAAVFVTAHVAHGQSAPSAEAVAKAGQQSVERLRNTAVSWHFQATNKEGTTISMKRIRHGSRQSVSYTLSAAGSPGFEMKVIEKDGLWYVTAGASRFKAKPYEALLPLPGFYTDLGTSDLAFITNRTQLGTTPPSSRSGGLAACYLPVAGPSRAIILRTKATVEEVRSKNPPADKLLEIEKVHAYAVALLEKGGEFLVNETNGLTIAYQTEDRPHAITDFQWLSGTPEADLTPPEGVKWEDRTIPWPAAEQENCILIHYAPFLPWDFTHDMSLHLLNVSSGEIRRLPSDYTGQRRACFDPSRRNLILATGANEDRMGLGRFDLAGGKYSDFESRPPDAVASGILELSPSGDKIVTVLIKTGDDLGSRICIINMADGSSSVIGNSKDLDYPGWLPDGDGFIVVRYKDPAYRGGSQPEIICRLALDGAVTELFEGSMPLVLRKTRRILYQEKNTRLWHICDLDGKNSALFGDGFDGHDSPVVSPDESKIVFMKKRFGKPSHPYLFTLGKTSGTRITRTDGFFAEPVWR